MRKPPFPTREGWLSYIVYYKYMFVCKGITY